MNLTPLACEDAENVNTLKRAYYLSSLSFITKVFLITSFSLFIFSNVWPAKCINRKGQFPIRCCLVLFAFFLKKIMSVTNEDTDQTPHSVASDLGLHCLSLSRKNYARLLWDNAYSCVIKEK